MPSEIRPIPGPWIVQNGNWIVTERSRFSVGQGVTRDDAILMSAAPDLLSALTGLKCFACHQWLEIVGRVIERLPCDVCEPAMAAIAKAKGHVDVADS